jgi:hypothetical protein
MRGSRAVLAAWKSWPGLTAECEHRSLPPKNLSKMSGFAWESATLRT